MNNKIIVLSVRDLELSNFILSLRLLILRSYFPTSASLMLFVFYKKTVRTISIKLFFPVLIQSRKMYFSNIKLPSSILKQNGGRSKTWLSSAFYKKTVGSRLYFVAIQSTAFSNTKVPFVSLRLNG